jgi:CubicO group peptidase (beta-lactamase class C family)
LQKIWTLVVTGILTMTIACSPNREEEVERLFSAYDGDGVPGAAVRVIYGGEQLLTREFGFADIDRQIPVTAATNFRLASLTKQFTAMSVLILVEEGRLSLDATLPELIAGFPSYAKNISVGYLLQHRSGLMDYESIMPEDVSEQVHDSDVLQMMMEADQTYFEPGTEYRYSNSGYAVLAMLVERLSGKTFAEFLRERIFEPIGMNNTLAFEDGVSTVPTRAYGYTVRDNAVEFTDQSPYSAVLGDGGIYSSLDDLFLWDQSLYTDDLITADSKALMLTPALENYGFGWRIDDYKGHRRYHHSGSTSGFRNYIVRFPDLKLTVIVLTNRAEPDVTSLAERVADLYLP